MVRHDDDSTLEASGSRMSSRQENPGAPELTQLLQQWSGGDEAALDRLVPLVDRELRKIASGFLRNDRANPTLDRTNRVKILANPSPITRTDVALQPRQVARDGIENAAIFAKFRSPAGRLPP